jgi:hypothetical protein
MTAGDGRFRIGNARDKELILTVMAKGFAPASKTVLPGTDTADLKFQLARGSLLTGVVKDEQDQPITNTSIRASNGYLNRQRHDWSTRSDVAGRFVWQDAPRGPETYYVSADGFESAREVSLLADGTEQVVKLKKSATNTRVTGTVTDAQTSQPIERFEVWLSPTTKGRNSDGSTYLASSYGQRKADGRNGKYGATIYADTIHYVVEIRANGYQPARGTNSVDGKDQTMDFALIKAAPLTGVVLAPDGSPAEGAVIVLNTEMMQATLRLPRQLQRGKYSGVSETMSGPDGRFTLEARAGATMIVVAHPAGYAYADAGLFLKSPILTLQPWGRIEGVIKITGATGSNEIVTLVPVSFGTDIGVAVEINMETRTDGEGRFTFEGLPSGEHRIGHRPRFANGRVTDYTATHDQVVLVKPGEAAQVTLGGSGRAVVGRAIFNSGTPVDWLRGSHTLSFPSKPPATLRGSSAGAADPQSSLTRAKAFAATEEGRAYHRSRRVYVPRFNPDGTFTIPDVLPGTYRLRLAPTSPTKMDSGASFRTPVATAEQEITVPALAENEADLPFEVGTVELKATPSSRSTSAVR